MLELDRIYNVTCLEGLQYLDDNSIDLTLTDPPWGQNIKYDGYDDSRENLIQIIKTSFPSLLKKSKRIAISPGIANIFLYPQSDWILSVCWNTTGSRCRYGYNQWMPILLYGKDLKGMGKINNVLKSDMIFINGGDGVGFRRKDISKQHPCPKPLNVIKQLILRLSNEGDLILDPFIGSGTTAVACKKLNRRFIGFEISPEYCEIANKRLMNVPQRLDLFIKGLKGGDVLST